MTDKNLILEIQEAIKPDILANHKTAINKDNEVREKYQQGIITCKESNKLNDEILRELCIANINLVNETTASIFKLPAKSARF